MTELKKNTDTPNFLKPVLSAVFSFTHKICPICKENKEVKEFAIYFSKSRNKHRISNYCKPCGRKEAKPRAIKNYKDNLELRKQYAKDYRANPEKKEKLKLVSQKFKIKYREELQDCYVRDRLTQENKIPNYVAKELPEIVETKRLQIKIKRKLKNLKNGKE